MLLHADSIAYATSTIGRSYVAVDSTGCTWTVDTSGPNSRRTLKRVATNNAAGGYLRYAPIRTQSGIWVPQAGLVIGFMLKVTSLARLATNSVLVDVFGGTNALGMQSMFRFRLNNNGTIVAGYYDHPNWGASLTTAGVVRDDTWVFLEFELNIAASGLIAINADGVEVGTHTGETRPARSGVVWDNKWSSVDLFGVTSEVSPFLEMRMLDIYLCDRAGSSNNTRLGVHEIRRCVPVSNGGTTNWTPNTGANYAAVDDVPADDDTTYVAATTAATRDIYVVGAVPAGVNPPGVVVSVLAKRTGDGVAAITPSLRGIDSANEIGVPDTGYRCLSQPYDTDPATAAAFVAANLAAAEVGILKSL